MSHRQRSHSDIPIDTSSMVLHKALKGLAERYKSCVEQQVPQPRGTASKKSPALKQHYVDPSLPALVTLLDDLIFQGECTHAMQLANTQIVGLCDDDPNAVEPFEITRAHLKYPNASPLHPMVMNDAKERDETSDVAYDHFSAYNEELADHPKRAAREKVIVGASPFARDFTRALFDPSM